MHNNLDSRLIERCEDIPDTPPTGNYVVVDVLHFSNTVVELLENGAEYIHITDERGEEHQFKAETPKAVIGGGSTESYTPEAGYDFFNSPSYVQRLDLTGRPVSMTSSNGGRAVAALRDSVTTDSEVYVGATTNARALGTSLRESDLPTYLVSAGTSGSVAVEDHIGATLVSRYLDAIPPAQGELDTFRRVIEIAKGPNYPEKHEVRRRDIYDYATQFNCRAVLPRLEGTSLVDAASEETDARTGRQASN